MIIEGFSLSEAVYMAIITIATVGFGEVRPLSFTGMWFTNFLIVISFGIFVFVVTTFTRYVIDGVLRNYFRDTKVIREINKLQGHVIICGYGRNGKQTARELLMHGIHFIVVESDPDLVESLRESNDILYIEGDATRDEILKQAGIGKARALITTLPVDADNLYVVLTAREINPSMVIISRASDEHADHKLKRAGATNVIMPDRLGGQRMAKLVIQPDVVEFFEYVMLQDPDQVALVEISCSNLATCFDGKSIREIDIRNESGANIIGMRSEDRSYLINPSPEIKLTKKDKLFVLGKKEQIVKLNYILSHEVQDAK